jgi:hypothetical protein
MGREELLGIVCEREMEDGAGDDGVGDSEGVLGTRLLPDEEGDEEESVVAVSWSLGTALYAK